jgi:hypothetical protein
LWFLPCTHDHTLRYSLPHSHGLIHVSLIFDLFWTRREVRRLAASETAKKHATQFLWSGIFFSMVSLGLGMAVSGFVWFSTDFIRISGVVFWSAITSIAIYPVLAMRNALPMRQAQARRLTLTVAEANEKTRWLNRRACLFDRA